MLRHLHREQFVPGDPGAVWEFFATPRNLGTLTSPHLRFEIISDVTGEMYPGQLFAYRVGIVPGLWTRWLTEITHVREGEYFVDEQRLGPYKLWHHEHHFAARADGRGVLMTDQIAYDPGWGALGGAVDELWLRHKLRMIFDYRAAKVAEIFARRPRPSRALMAAS